MKTGKIVIGIDKKVYFEYYELREPDTDRLKFAFIIGYNKYKLALKEFKRDVIKYKASKQLIEVSNRINFLIEDARWMLLPQEVGCTEGWEIIENNQKCKAEITGETCTIVELIKEKDSYKKRT